MLPDAQSQQTEVRAFYDMCLKRRKSIKMLSKCCQNRVQRRKKKSQIAVLQQFGIDFERCLAESNRSSRFCRPVPNRSAKAPFPYWDCKYSNFCRNCKILFNFFCITLREHVYHCFQLNRSVLHNDLFHVKQQSLKVLAFRMVDVHRVVTWLIEAVKDADSAASLGCS